MNIPVLIVACITLLAVIAHVIGGTRETAALAPPEDDAKLSSHWVQAMCAFQMLAVDLALVTALLFAIALYDLGPSESLITLGLAGLYLVWGVVWVVQMLWLKRKSVGLFRLPHWIVWFFCAALLFAGS